MVIINFGLVGLGLRRSRLEGEQEENDSSGYKPDDSALLAAGFATRKSPFSNIIGCDYARLVEAGHANGKHLPLELPQIEAEGAVNRRLVHVNQLDVQARVS